MLGSYNESLYESHLEGSVRVGDEVFNEAAGAAPRRNLQRLARMPRGQRGPQRPRCRRTADSGQNAKHMRTAQKFLGLAGRLLAEVF